MFLFGGPYSNASFMDDESAVPPPVLPPVVYPPTYDDDEEDIQMIIGSVSHKLTAAGAEAKTSIIPRTTDISVNTPSRQRYLVAQIDVVIDAGSGSVTAVFDAGGNTNYVFTGRRLMIAVPPAASILTVTFPGAGTAIVTYGRPGG